MNSHRFGNILATTLACLAPLAVHGYYRGDEYEARDYAFDAEYFLDQLPLLPSLEERLGYAAATNAYWASGGSYTRKDLFLMQYLKLRKDFEPPFSFQFDFEMDQDFDGIYEHHMVDGGWRLNDAWTAHVVAEPLSRKEFSDFGVAVDRRTARSQARAEFLLPDFEFEGKNDLDGSFVTQPYTLRGTCLQAVRDRLTLFAAVDLDFPSETRYADPAFDFEYESYKPSAGAAWRLDERSTVWGEAGGESTDKRRTSFDGTAVEDFHTDRQVAQGRVEYVHQAADRTRWTAGLKCVNFDESNDYPNCPTNSLDYDHVSRLVYGTWRTPLVGRFYFNTGLHLDFVRHLETHPAEEERNYRAGEFEGKIPFSVEWLNATCRIEAGLSMQVDQVAFGGGFAGARVIF